VGSITREDVIAALGMSSSAVDPSTPDGMWLDDTVAAINISVPRVVPTVRAADPSLPWPDDVHAGAVLQAGRLFQRRASMGGALQAYDSMGPTYIARWDPDVERMFGIGPWEPPKVG